MASVERPDDVKDPDVGGAVSAVSVSGASACPADGGIDIVVGDDHIQGIDIPEYNSGETVRDPDRESIV